MIVALDTGSLAEAKATVERLSGHASAFKVGHGLVLPHGLGVVDELRGAGAKKIFLDLKFHDIPNSVAIAVHEAAKRGVWMMTLHAAGGSAMMAAAVEAAGSAADGVPPLLVAVTVLTSIDEPTLADELGVARKLSDQVEQTARLAISSGVDGVVCSGFEVARLRQALGDQPILVVPGIRQQSAASQDQRRVVTASEAIARGASYVVVGRALTASDNPEKALAGLGL